MEYRHEIKHLITQADAIAIRNNLSVVAESDPHVKDDGDSSETKVMPQSFPQDVDFSSFMGGGNRGGFGGGGFSAGGFSGFSRSSGSQSGSSEGQQSADRTMQESWNMPTGGMPEGFSGRFPGSSSSVSKSTWIQFGIYVLILLAAIVVVWRLRKHND